MFLRSLMLTIMSSGGGVTVAGHPERARPVPDRRPFADQFVGHDGQLGFGGVAFVPVDLAAMRIVRNA
jgi:hypothetical protein